MKQGHALLCIDTATYRVRRYVRNFFGAILTTDEMEIERPVTMLDQLKMDLEYFRMFKMRPEEQPRDPEAA